jgi:coproporphyrinogen III oxidase-like Fe-S oxidoreductase
MLWFERPFLQVLRREYASAMRFAEDDEAEVMPAAPEGACQLYVHVPFCEVLCPFCSFHRVRYNADKTARYFAALRQEIRLYHDAGFRFSDVYVGGGTPTVSPPELLATLELIRAASPVQTISIETNPNHLEPEVLARYRDAGVTRFSVGVQSFDDGLLAGMDRLEKYGSGALIRERLAGIRGVFPTLNVDMIFNLPGQTLAMLDRDIDALLELDVDQVSFYPLMTASTARHKMHKTMGEADESLRHAMYERVLDRMLPRYRASSAWCFTRGEGMFDEYIIDEDDYVGVGSGAFSYVDGSMYSTTFSLNHYCRRIEGGQSGITQRRTLGARERMRYDYLVRLFGGTLKREYIAERYGAAFWLLLAPELAAMRAVGATRHDADALRLTRRGMYCWVLMMSEFFNSVNDVREHMREHIRAELDAWNEEATVPVESIGGLARSVRP